MSYLYLCINLLTISIPLALSFYPTLKFYQNWGKLLGSFIIVGLPFIIWDVIFTHIGIWEFNRLYTSNFRILGLPLAEILFFITVPYACIFIFEAIKYHLPQWKLPKRFVSRVLLIFSLVLFLTGFIFIDLTYTSIIMWVSALTCLVLERLSRINQLAYTSSFWLFLVLSFAGFVLVNGILTSLPIVTYNEAEFTIRMGSIPLEDFFYNFSLLTLYLCAYTSMPIIFDYFKKLNDNK